MDAEDIQAFQIENLSSTSTVGRPFYYIIIGDNDELAATVIKNICFAIHSKVKFVNVFSPRSKWKDIYKEFIPASCIYHTFNKETLNKLFKKQKATLESFDQLNLLPEEKNSLKSTFHTVIILDQCATEDTKLSPELNTFFEYAKDLHITLIWRSIESVISIPSMLRHKYDYCFVLSATGAKEQTKIFSAFGGMALNIKNFRNLINFTITPQICLAITKNLASNTPQDEFSDKWMLHFTRFEPNRSLPVFRMGLERLWNYAGVGINGSGNESGGYTVDGVTGVSRFPSSNGNGNENNDDRDNGNDHHRVVDLQTILQTYSKNKKIRIQIIDSDDEDGNDHNDDDNYTNYNDDKADKANNETEMKSQIYNNTHTNNSDILDIVDKVNKLNTNENVENAEIERKGMLQEFFLL